MSVSYSLVKYVPKFGKNAGKGKFYARAQVNEKTSLKMLRPGIDKLDSGLGILARALQLDNLSYTESLVLDAVALFQQTIPVFSIA